MYQYIRTLMSIRSRLSLDENLQSGNVRTGRLVMVFTSCFMIRNVTQKHDHLIQVNLFVVEYSCERGGS